MTAKTDWPLLQKALRDPGIFGQFLKDPTTWAAWMVVLKSIFGGKLTPAELRLFQQCTGRTQPFAKPVKEAWIAVGRRAGKTYIGAILVAFLAAFRDYSTSLSPGERAVVLVLATNRDQARVAFRYVEAVFDAVPLLAKMVVSRTAESLELNNRVTVEVGTCSYRSIRGRTVVACLADEVSFWRSEESANPAQEVMSALRPAMATIRDPLLLAISSPYSRAGVLYEAVERHHGVDASDVLCWRADTRTMNPTIPQALIDEAFASDPAAAASEWLGEFRSDVASFLEDQWIAGAIDPVHERPAAAGVRYYAFVDPSGGKRDSFTVAVAHRDGKDLILDLVREFRPPFKPDDVVGEIEFLLVPYHVRTVTGDNYSAGWAQEAFQRRRLRYEVSALNRSQIYLETGALLAQGRIRLVDAHRLTVQLRQLERRTSIAGRDAVNHPPGGSDDVANAAMGALWLASQGSGRLAPRSPGRAITDWDPLARPSGPGFALM